MSYDDAGLAYFLDSCCEHWSETVTADRKGMIAVRDKLARLTAEVERLRSALRLALSYVQPIDHEGPSEDEIRESYPEYVAKVDADRAQIRAALAPHQQADATGGEVDERDVRAAATALLLNVSPIGDDGFMSRVPNRCLRSLGRALRLPPPDSGTGEKL